MPLLPVGGVGTGGGGGGLTLGPRRRTPSRLRPRPLRRRRGTPYATANPLWLAQYDAEATFTIVISWPATPTNTLYQSRRSSAWADVTGLVRGQRGITGTAGSDGAAGDRWDRRHSTGADGADGGCGTRRHSRQRTEQQEPTALRALWGRLVLLAQAQPERRHHSAGLRRLPLPTQRSQATIRQLCEHPGDRGKQTYSPTWAGSLLPLSATSLPLQSPTAGFSN